MRPAFPTSAYYGGSAPPRGDRLTVRPARPDLAGRAAGQLRGGSHVHHLTVRRDRRPAIPRRPRHDYPAALHRGLRPGQPWTWPKFPRRLFVLTEVRTADRPRSARFEPTFHFRGFHHWFLHTYACPSRLPGPGRLAVPTRPVVVGAAPTTLDTSRARLPPASSGRCDGPNEEGLPPPCGHAAPRGAPGWSTRSSSSAPRGRR